jgi:xanthine/uracil/vitamin C permease (AzgA family)
MLIVATMLTNIIAETMCASVAASPALMRSSHRSTSAIAFSVCTEDNLPQVGPPVVDLSAVAFHEASASL